MIQESKSSFHIEAGKIYSTLHGSRSIPTENTIFNDEENEYDISGEQAIQKYQRLLKPRIEAYTKRTGQKLQKNAITHLSAIVNTKQTTSMEELKKLTKHLEETLGTKVFQICIHRDEGHIKDGRNIKNYHAHIEMLGLDEEGHSIRRKLTRSVLSKLQDKTAEILQMSRGTNYIKEKKKRPRRLNTYAYKIAKEMVEKAVEAVKKEFNAKINKLQNELKGPLNDKIAAEKVFRELISKLKLQIVKGQTYSYDAIKEMILDEFTQRNETINQLQKQNNTYISYLKNAKKMMLDLEQKRLDLTDALKNAQQELESTIVKNDKLEDEIKMLKTFTKQEEENEDYENHIGIGF